MGYRSTVAIVLNSNVDLDFSAHKCKAIQFISGSFLEKLYATSGESVVYLAEDIKWYDDNPLRVLVEDFLVDLEDDQDYFYIVVGEEVGDLKEEGNTELQDYWDLYVQWGLDTNGLRNPAMPQKNLANSDPHLVHSPMYQVELMLCWENYRWTDGEYIYISCLVTDDEVESLAIKTYNDNLIEPI